MHQKSGQTSPYQKGTLGETGASFEWLLQLALRNIYIQVMYNRWVPVPINPFVYLCTIKGSIESRRSGHGGTLEYNSTNNEDENSTRI